jgi:uncharacterized protein YukJ
VFLRLGSHCAGQPDDHWHFLPEQGVHDIHVRQKNKGEFVDNNPVNGDGAMFARVPAGTETFALFYPFFYPEADENGTPL